MTDEHDLRSRLERIASSAGDPPEHGFERVAARRHRRLRRRRGAVVTAVALAVLATSVWLVREPHRPADVAAVQVERSAGAPTARLPDRVEVTCSTGGIDVPVASVRPRRDGLHLRVHNAGRTPVTVQVDGESWSSGPVRVDPGMNDLRTPVPPGVLTIGCERRGERHQRRVDLVDVDGMYTPPALSCDADDQRILGDLPVAPATRSLLAATRRALDAHLQEGDEVSAARGYASQRLGDPMADPVTQVTRGGEVVAFVHLRGPDGDVHPPWSTALEVEACSSLLGDDVAGADRSVETGGAEPGTTAVEGTGRASED